MQVMCARPSNDWCQKKRVLHVQSMSEWAPCCIGPYSQATSYDGLVRFAGQIAMDPTNCSIPQDMSLNDQVVRVSKTCDLVGAAMKIDYKQTMLWSNIFISDAVVEDCEDGFQSQVLQVLDPRDSDTEEEYTEEYLVATSRSLPLVNLPMKQMTMVIQCPHLPKDAKLEIQSVNINIEALNTFPQSDSKEEGEGTHDWVSSLQYKQLSPSKHCLFSKGTFMKLNMTTSNESITEEDIMHSVSLCEKTSGLTSADIVSITAYVNTSSTKSDYRDIESAIGRACQGIGHNAVFTVPVSGLWNAMDFEQCHASKTIGIEILWYSHKNKI